MFTLSVSMNNNKEGISFFQCTLDDLRHELPCVLQYPYLSYKCTYMVCCKAYQNVYSPAPQQPLPALRTALMTPSYHG